MTERAVAAGLDWGRLAPLKLRAREIADGLYAGAHRSVRRGAGVEFGGHRNYLPGDDLRFLDRRSLLRHDRLLVREFETETDRSVQLVVDASRSMGYRSDGAPGAKLAFAALIAAVFARVAISGQDTVSLDFIGGGPDVALPSMGGAEAFERLVAALESVEPAGNVHASLEFVDRACARVERRARRGAVVLVLSDFLDLPKGGLERVAALGTNGRIVTGVRVLDPAEATFPFTGPISFRSSEGDDRVETDGAAARADYLGALAALTDRTRNAFLSHGGRFVDATTADDPVDVSKRVLAVLARGAR